jgi:hypothetical protein
MPKPKTADQHVERKRPPVERPVLRHNEATDSDAIESSIGLGSPLDTVPTIDVNLARHFRDIGVVTIGQFLELDPDDASSRLAKHRIRTDQVTRWQSEISLQVYLCISGNDARILVECGISDPEDLAIADLEHLHRRISGFLNSDEVRNRYQPFSPMDRDTLARWIEMSRRSNYRRNQLRSQRDADSSRQREPRTRTRPERQISTNRRRETPVTIRPRTTSVRPSEPNPIEDSEANNGESLKFYLNMEDPIVDAPSIGPKTAERFHTVGINTVADFLAADPIATAEQIDYRRVTAEIISEWQIQAKLATQIPNLRGHDAQILAACEVTDADELTRADASTLFKRVKRFVSTTEGKRILRNGKRPDQNEISNWIRWSEDARQLEVA